jgi:iron complex outermembrane recepter protein
VRVEGGEVDLAASLFGGLTLRASVAYADGENTDYPAGPCALEAQTAATVACNLTGVPLAGLSELSGSLGFDYQRPIGAGDFSVHWVTNSRDGYNSDTSGSQFTTIDGFSVTNASIGYGFGRGWEVDVFARNLFNEEYITALTIQTGNSGLILGQPGEPRTVGLTFHYAKANE